MAIMWQVVNRSRLFEKCPTGHHGLQDWTESQQFSNTTCRRFSALRAEEETKANSKLSSYMSK